MDDKEILPENGNDDEDVEFFDESDFAGDDEMAYYDDFEEETDPLIRAMDVTESNVDKLLSISTAEAVYGEPIEYEDSLIIPAAELVGAMGFGVGYGAGGDRGEGDEESTAQGEGGGGGGGGYSFSRPVAVIIATPDGVRIEPVVDVTKVALAALTAFGFMVSALWKMRRG